MPKVSEWTDGLDAQIRRLRVEGASWDIIAMAIGKSYFAVIERARAIGVDTLTQVARQLEDDDDRDPLPAGHPASWNAIIANSCLSGAAYA